jgi:alkanesulfonate monooxygenase SsuD/methylene tetrahydromethanopterin reductase-like flavin-dependent oxidoreductase (luciferase family)
MDSAEIFEEGMEVVLKAWNSPGPWSHKGQFFDIPEMEITPKPVQKPIPFYVASFSKTSADMAAKHGLNIIYAPFAAGMVYGGLERAVESYRAKCTVLGNTPGRAMCSYFIHIADDAGAEDYGRERQMAYFKHCVLPAFPDDPANAPPTMHYFLDIIRILETMKKEDLGERSILIGPPSKIIDSLKKVQAAGIEEVILYFNVGNKPDSMVREQMHRFQEEIAPAFN